MSDALAGRNLDLRLREELQIARKAVEIERGLEALRTESKSLKFAESIVHDRAMEGVRKVRAYGGSRAVGERQVRSRTRAMYKLTRGGIPRLLVEAKLSGEAGSDAEGAERLQRARALHRLIGHDVRVLDRHRRSEERARSELISASREMATASSLQMIRELQESILTASMDSLRPQLRRARKRTNAALARVHELNNWERRVLRQVKQEYRT
ncbi:MAG: hypothetical protein ACPHRO_00715, partial [Nannocystaceae bacterium]